MAKESKSNLGIVALIVISSVIAVFAALRLLAFGAKGVTGMIMCGNPAGCPRDENR